MLDFGSGFANQQLSAGYNVYALNDLSYTLMNRVTPDMSPQQVAAIHSFDKAIQLSKAQEQLRSDYTFAAAQDAKSREKAGVKRREQNIQNGYIFA